MKNKGGFIGVFEAGLLEKLQSSHRLVQSNVDFGQMKVKLDDFLVFQGGSELFLSISVQTQLEIAPSEPLLPPPVLELA